jgi:PAS domain S-box-containing protein
MELARILLSSNQSRTDATAATLGKGGPMSDILRAAGAIADGFAALDGAEVALVVDADGRIMTWSPEAERLTGFSEAEAIGREPSLLFAGNGEGHGEAVRLLENARRTGRASFTRPIVCKRRSSFWGDIRVIALGDKNERTLGYLFLLRDLRARQEFVPQLQRLRIIEEALQDAAGGAHDLNNLVTVLLSEASAAPRHDAPARGHAEAVGAVAHRMAALLQHFVRVVKGQRRPPAPLNVNEVVTWVVRALGLAADEGGKTIVNLHPAVSGVRADVLEIEEVVLNLVINARHATQSGGYILLETSNVQVARPTTLKGQTLRVGDFVRVAVRDSGGGMTDEALAHLFEPFYSTKGPDHGTGLGLSNAVRIVNRSGGTILVRSKEGWGTLAEVYLPAADAP